MAATILAGSIGTLAMASVRAAAAAEGNTLQNFNVLATAIDAASKTNEGVFSGRANRLFSTPLALDGDAFGINTGASAEHHVAVSSRERGRKLQDEDDDDQCDSAITVTSALFEDAEGCYEHVDDLYYLSADGEHVISSFTAIVGSAEMELKLGWVYGSFSNEDDSSQATVSTVCYCEDSDVPLDEIDMWECELDGGSVAFSPVSSSDFSVSCGCSETPAPTGNGTNGEVSPAPSEGRTMTSTSEDTPAPSIEQGQTAAPSADSRGIGSMAPTVETTEESTPSTNGPTHSPHSPTHFADFTMPPTGAPTMSPTGMPTMFPTGVPTMSPTGMPTMSPTGMPTMFPTGVPTMSPTGMPTMSPTGMPTMFPTGVPTMSPTGMPSNSDRSVDSSSTASPSVSPTPPDGFDPTNVGTLPFKMSTLGMVGTSVAAIFVGLMPFVV